jgi:hypothetical protein
MEAGEYQPAVHKKAFDHIRDLQELSCSTTPVQRPEAWAALAQLKALSVLCAHSISVRAGRRSAPHPD